jgi:hypothetical protein
MQSKLAHAAERKAFSIALDQALKTVAGPDREKNIDKFVDMAGKLLKDTNPGATRGMKAALYPGVEVGEVPVRRYRPDRPQRAQDCHPQWRL